MMVFKNQSICINLLAEFEVQTKWFGKGLAAIRNKKRKPL